MAKTIVDHHGKGRFEAVRAAVDPAVQVEPLALDVLRQAGFDVEPTPPQHWGDFVGETAESLDFVFTLSDTAAGESIPDWPGGPVTAHWSYPDPVLTEGDGWEKRQAYGRLLAGLERHLRTFMEFPIATLDRLTLQQKITELGRSSVSAD